MPRKAIRHGIFPDASLVIGRVANGGVNMQASAVPLSPIDSLLECYGFYVSAGFRRYRTLHWHIHRGTEIIYIHSGTADVYTHQWHHSLYAGNVILTHASVAHGWGGNFNRSVVHFVPELLTREAYDKIAKLLDKDNYYLTSLDAKSARRCNWAIQELHSLNKWNGTISLAQALMGLIAAEMELSALQQNRAQRPFHLQQIIDYMKANIASDEKLACLADRFQISTRLLYNLFVTQYGCSPKQYWQALKLEYARNLLQSNQRINDVALAVGFQSARGFQRAFQRAYDVSPSQFRAIVGEQPRNQ